MLDEYLTFLSSADRLSARPFSRQELELAAFSERLRKGREAERVGAAKTLASLGPPAVAPLCAALRDRALAVRIAAAGSLGVIGDARAALPLSAAVRASLDGGSGRQHRRNGASCLAWMILLLAVPAAILVLVGGQAPIVLSILAMGGLQALMIGGGGAVAALQARRDDGRLAGAAADALARIAEKTDLPELRSLLPDLHAIEFDLLQQLPSTREAARRAAVVIESRKGEWETLPLPVAPSGSRAAALPRIRN